MFEKRPKYLGNDVDLWEIAQICGEMTNYLSNFLKCGKWLRDLGNGPKYLGNDVDLWEMVQICGEMT